MPPVAATLRMAETDKKPPTFFEQLKRRRVIRVAIAYAAGGFVILQVADLVFPAFGISAAVYRALVIATVVGFPVALVLTWLFDLSPEGLRRADADGTSGPVIAGVSPWLKVVGGAATTMVIVAVGVLVLLPRSAPGVVVPGTDVIAVLPFATSGPGTEGVDVGMVDLLSRNLNEVGVVRTVEPRLILYSWSQRDNDGPLGNEEALAIGRAVGAGSVLLGSAVVVDQEARLTGQLYTVDDGSLVADVRVDGSRDEMLSLVDGLSLEILQEIWRSDNPVPGFDVQAITTGSPQAIRAFLEGERFYRTSQWDSAVSAFERAIEQDSTFALAYYRLARSVTWTGHPNAPEVARRATEQAVRFSGRLPSRERTLVVAQDLRRAGQARESADTLRDHLERFPDDLEAAFMLADGEYHRREEEDALAAYQRPLRQRLRPFDRILAFDPSFTPALIHPLELSFAFFDTTRIATYVDLLENAAPTDTAAIETYRAGLAVLRNPRDVDGLLEALSRVMRADESQDMAWQARMALDRPLIRVAIGLPADLKQRVIDWLVARVQEEPSLSRTSTSTLNLLIASGRLREARALLESPGVRAGLGNGTALYFELLPFNAEFVDTAYVQGTIGATLADEVQLELGMLAAIDGADTTAIRQHADLARSLGSQIGKPWLGSVASAGAGFIKVLEGEPGQGLDSVAAAVGHFSNQSEALRFRWLEWMAAYRRTRERSEALLVKPWMGNPAYDIPRVHMLGVISETRGDSAAARAYYDLFVTALEGADPGLRIEVRADSARAALRRLAPAGEGG